MKALLCLLLLLAGLVVLLPAAPAQEQEEILGYWLAADGHATEFIRGPDGYIFRR